jgi:hypothetical protein
MLILEVPRQCRLPLAAATCRAHADGSVDLPLPSPQGGPHARLLHRRHLGEALATCEWLGCPAPLCAGRCRGRPGRAGGDRRHSPFLRATHLPKEGGQAASGGGRNNNRSGIRGGGCRRPPSSRAPTRPARPRPTGPACQARAGRLLPPRPLPRRPPPPSCRCGEIQAPSGLPNVRPSVGHLGDLCCRRRRVSLEPAGPAPRRCVMPSRAPVTLASIQR